MIWHTDGPSPVYLQLAESIRHAVICGESPPGSRLPSVRELSFDAKVNPNTMQRALFELEREGLIETRGTIGKFVTENASVIADARAKATGILIDEFLTRASEIGCTRDELIELIKERNGS